MGFSGKEGWVKALKQRHGLVHLAAGKADMVQKAPQLGIRPGSQVAIYIHYSYIN